MSLISSLLIGLAILSIALIPLEVMWPGEPRQRRFRRGWSLDVVYWFFTALITKPIAKFAVVIALLPLFTAYAIFQHANVRWDFGPLRRVFASPTFHRWHHTSAEEGRDKNFAGLLPLWDILFGTYYMPAQQPSQFGVAEPIPGDLIGQLVWPFRRRQTVDAKSSQF